MSRIKLIGILYGTLVLLALGLVALSCTPKPPELTPQGEVYFYGNEGAVALGTVQHVAIQLNYATGRAHLDDNDTRMVVETVQIALASMRAAPEGWQAATREALDQIDMRLSAAGKTKLHPYLQAARMLVGFL